MALDRAERAIAATEPGVQLGEEPPTPPLADPAAAPDKHEARCPILSLKEQREALREGKLIGFHCPKDKLDRFSPMARCPACGGPVQRREFSKTGTVVSYTIQSVASDQFLNETPFAFAIIQLDDGPRVSGWIPWIAKPKDLPLGQKVEYTPSYKPGMVFEKK